MKRTLLYYPTIKIPDENWVRQAILYWDEVGSIVPHHFFRSIRENEVQAELANLGLFRPFAPEEYVEKNKQLAIEYVGIINSGVFGEETRDVDAAVRRNSYIYEYKFMHEVKHYLVRQGYAKQVDNKVFMDWRLGLLYMALLAKYMANDDEEAITTQSSIHPKYRDLILSTKYKSKALPSISISLNNILPVPREDVNIKKVLRFKLKHKDALDNFRKVLFENQKRFCNTEEVNEAKEIVEQFKTDITKEVNSISDTFRKEKLPFVLGLFENILKVETPAVITAFIPTVNPSVTIPVPLIIAGAAIGGAITVTKYLLDKHNERQKQLADNSFSYIYHAQQEGII